MFDSIHADVTLPPYGDSHCLYTTQNPGLAIFHHSSPVRNSAINQLVWEYMLTSDFSTSIAKTIKETEVLIFPNPSNSAFTIFSDENLFNKKYIVQNLNGQTIQIGNLVNPEINKIDLSKFENGIYFLTIDKKTFKIIKQD